VYCFDRFDAAVRAVETVLSRCDLVAARNEMGSLEIRIAGVYCTV
jgi:hypothetical protein